MTSTSISAAMQSMVLYNQETLNICDNGSTAEASLKENNIGIKIKYIITTSFTSIPPIGNFYFRYCGYYLCSEGQGTL